MLYKTGTDFKSVPVLLSESVPVHPIAIVHLAFERPLIINAAAPTTVQVRACGNPDVSFQHKPDRLTGVRKPAAAFMDFVRQWAFLAGIH